MRKKEIDKNIHHSIISMCMLDRSIFESNYPMTFVHAEFCCDAYQKNPTVVVVISSFIQFRDRVSSFDELPPVNDRSRH